MPDPFVYFRLPRRVSSVAEIVHSPGAMADLLAVATLEPNQTAALRDRLQSARGFLDPSALKASIASVVTNEDLAGSVQRVLTHIEPENVEPLLDTLEDHLEQEKPPCNDDTLEALRAVLPKLIILYPALARFKKAERLASATGRQLESLDLICDLRPVFDEERSSLEGMMPYTRLRVVASGTDDLPTSFEVELTQRQVADLADKAERAKRKLDVLCSSIENWVPGGVPQLPLTRPGSNE
jgi:hypothetical protein